VDVKRISVLVVFWLAFVAFIGPALISHRSYELPIVGLALACLGAWGTYRILKRNPQ
jgi:hypothetical protein